MPRGPKPTPITLTDDQRTKLANWARRPTSAQRLALRAKIVLAAVEGHTNAAIATNLRVTVPTVRKWRDRFSQRRLEGLADEPRPGTPRTITDEQVETAVTRTLESKPANATHWSPRTRARELGLSQTAIVGIWHAFGIKPHRHGSFRASPPTRSSSRRSGTLSDSTWPRRNGPSCCAWTRKARSRPSTAPNRFSRCCRAYPKRAATTPCGTAPPPCSRHSTLPPGR